jgi:hypothetical protein
MDEDLLPLLAFPYHPNAVIWEDRNEDGKAKSVSKIKNNRS